ncbi:hypothetical protein [Psychroserpens damuponensis]|uniref:hypothetical protein n=1 Tax=Psychroserpens damuponensis TaxID=943936 RepID=UPI00058FB1C6|nr:hypothetical protein [Psychroserpens damuponensis]
MKKLVLIILGFILGALAMYFYCVNNQSKDNMTETPTPSGIINPEEITTLTEAYNPRYDTVTKAFFRGVPDGDNRSSWYSLEDLRNYLTIAEKQANGLKYNMDGVRIYLGAKAATGKAPGYTTMLFVPTGTPMTSEGKILNLAPLQGGGGSRDIPGAKGLDMGGEGTPPGVNYPQ